VTDSSATEENKIDDILQGLLTCDNEELEGEGAMNLLRERLQVKPIVMEKLSVPDFPNIQPIDLESLRENSSKPRKALSNIDNLLKGMNIKTPRRQDVGYAEKQLGSPTPPRSPFASLSSLKKHISRSKLSSDPFSFHEIDHIPTRSYSSTHMINQEVNIFSSSKLSDEPSSPIIKDVIAAGETNSIMETTDNSKEDTSRKSCDKVNASIIEDVAVSETSLSDDPDRNYTSTPQKSMVDNTREPVFNAASETNTILGTTENSKENNSKKSSDKVNAPINEDIVAISETSLRDDPDRNCTGTHQKSMVDNSREPGFNADVDSNELHVDMDMDIGGGDMGKGVMDDMAGRQNVAPNEPHQFEDKVCYL
jgi:hypothetical protein